MHIKKLEISGFKSFVDRTVVHFDHDVIGIVGPNGCGKSNIVDAIRWVMGEQSAKALRGKGMGDVIFNGSESRTQAGFCEVTVTFDNSDPAMAQHLPLEYRDYADLSVTRRMYRGDGQNDYFINKTPVRLRDVHEVFMGTGVGRKAYSIVEQGKIGVIVSARPEDRRIIIEEAAGITKYKARKRQAEQKMDQTRQNLSRIRDIVAEIERQIGSLKRQAAKAERYLRYRGELDDLILWEASHRLLELVAVAGVAEQARNDAAERCSAQRAEVDARDAAVEVLRQEAKSAEQHAERASSTVFVNDNEVREVEVTIERAGDRYRLLDGQLATARDEQVALEQRARALADEEVSLSARTAGIETEQEREDARVHAEAEELVRLQQASDAATEHLSGLRRQESTAAAAIARAEAEAQGLERRRDDVELRRARLSGELFRLGDERAEIDLGCMTARARVQALETEQGEVRAARDGLATELPLLRAEVTERERSLDGRRVELHRARSRLRALEEIAERMEGLGAGVRNLLSTGDGALAGILADRIEVPAEYTAAVAGLVGDRLQCVVVDDLDRALELLRGLAAERRGRATVIPRSFDERPTLVPLEALPEGAIGLVVDLLRYAPEDEGAVRALVGDAVLVHGDADARRLQGIRADLVTLDGTVFHADGRVTGGAGDALATGMLVEKREMRELAELCERVGAEVDAAESELGALRLGLAGLEGELDVAKSRAHAKEIELVNGRQDLGRLEQKLGLVSRRRDEVAVEVTELGRAAEAARVEREKNLEVLAAARATRDAAAAALAEAEAVARSARDATARQQALFTERKVELAAVSERLRGALAALERVGRERADLGERIEGLESDRSRWAGEAGVLAAELCLSRERLLDARKRARQAHVAFESARQELDDLRHGLGLREAELRELRGSLQEVQSELGEIEMRLQRLVLERQHLEDGIRERFRGLELKSVVGDHHLRPQAGDNERARIRELSELIDRMGSVNLDAMKEYEEASERFTFYTGQHDDLTKALADLEKAITQMNRESRRLFKHAFDGISRRFQEIFPKLFRGGKAELRLTNPEDLLETGVDILAQPPGKKLSHIELMSGGEKAFTAVALLMAIFRYKPSPFCILDEVDAPLDEANIDRYIEGVRSMTDRSQFILITHSKRTMQAVDVLYGVTMQEPGVSKLVGVRVADDAQARSTRRTVTAPPAAEAAEDTGTDDTAVVA